MPTLQLPEASDTELRSWARDAHPEEACGVLLGTRAGSHTVVRRVVRGRNIEPQQRERRFELDPAALVRAEDEARVVGWEVVGIWHTHPDGDALPSPADLAAAEPTWAHLVVAVASDGTTERRAFRLSPRGFHELAIRPITTRPVTTRPVTTRTGVPPPSPG